MKRSQVGNDEADDAEEEDEEQQQAAPQQQQQQQAGGGGSGEEEQQSFGGLTEAELAQILWDQASVYFVWGPLFVRGQTRFDCGSLLCAVRWGLAVQQGLWDQDVSIGASSLVKLALMLSPAPS